jgi:hypothetical protein
MPKARCGEFSPQAFAAAPLLDTRVRPGLHAHRIRGQKIDLHLHVRRISDLGDRSARRDDLRAFGKDFQHHTVDRSVHFDTTPVAAVAGAGLHQAGLGALLLALPEQKIGFRLPDRRPGGLPRR